VIIGIVVAVVALLVVPVVVPSVGFGVLTHVECQGGAVLATGQFWTPIILLNSPYRGNASGVGVGVLIRATDGEVDGVFDLDQWTLRAATNVAVLGPGLSRPCTTSGVASYAAGENFASQQLLAIGATSDANVGTEFALNGYPSVSFFDSGGPSGELLNYCDNTASQNQTASSVYYQVLVSFSGPNAGRPMWYLLPAPASYSYQFPAGSAWNVQFGKSVSPGDYDGGWLFNYTTCVNAKPAV